MPFQKRKPRKNVKNWVNLRKQKIAIKKRLLEISIRVDGYIYRNKPITVEEAEKYLVEIAIHQTRCNNDIHILQVIEKLTRCMKTIIEETKQKLPPNQDVPTSVSDQRIDLLPSFTNRHKDSNILHDGNFGETIKAVSQSKDQNSNIAVIIVISDSEDEDKGNKYNAQLTDKINSPSFNTNGNKASTKKADSLNNLTTQLAQSNNSNSENKHLNPDESYCCKITDATKESVYDNCNLVVTKGKKTRQYKNKNNKNVKNTLQTSIQPTYQLENKKKRESEATQKSLPRGKRVNLDTALNTNPPKELNLASNKTKNRVLKKKTNTDLSDKPNKRKKSSNKNIKIINNHISSNCKELNTSPSVTAPLICAPIKNSHRHIDISDEVSLPVPRTDDAGSCTITNHDSVANKMSTLTIYNEKAVNDFSWIEDIRYVREISTDEFDPVPSWINETFWNDFSLPCEKETLISCNKKL